MMNVQGHRICVLRRERRAKSPARRRMQIRWPGAWSLVALSVVANMLIFSKTSFAENNFSAKKSQAFGPITEPLQNIPVGEKLVYEVFWMGVPVGFGEFSILEKIDLGGKQVYPIVAVARTNEVLSKIYPVYDEIRSWMDADTLQSLQFEKKVSEGFYRAHEKVRYDAAAKKGTYESLKNGSKKEFDVSVPVQDVLTSFLWLRRQTLLPGRSIQSKVNNGEKDYDLEVEVLRREQKELRGQGMVDTLLVEPKTRLEGILEKRGRVWVHLKNEPLRTPVLITFKTPFGPVVGVLKKSEILF